MSSYLSWGIKSLFGIGGGYSQAVSAHKLKEGEGLKAAIATSGGLLMNDISGWGVLWDKTTLVSGFAINTLSSLKSLYSGIKEKNPPSLKDLGRTVLNGTATVLMSIASSETVSNWARGIGFGTLSFNLIGYGVKNIHEDKIAKGAFKIALGTLTGIYAYVTLNSEALEALDQSSLAETRRALYPDSKSSILDIMPKELLPQLNSSDVSGVCILPNSKAICPAVCPLTNTTSE